MKYKIRAAVESDSKEINEVSTFLGYSKLSAEQAHNNLNFLINSVADNVYVAEVNGKIVGWIHVFYAAKLASDSFYEIGGLVVNPEFRGQSIGRSLVQYAFDCLKGTFRVRSNQKRTQAHDFYKSLGFKVTKTQCVLEAQLA